MSALFLEYNTDPNQQKPLPDVFTPVTEKSRKVKHYSFIGLTILASLATVLYSFISFGTNGLIVMGFALLPLAILVLITLFLTPRSEVAFPLRLWAIIWGGAGATSFTLLVSSIFNGIFGQPDMVTTAVVQAAIVEEIGKAIFLFALFWFAKHLIKTPLAGATLGILVGAGFAFIENILYFNRAFVSTGWEGLFQIFIMRAGMSFFLHSLATMFTGLLIGYAISKGFSFWKTFIVTETGLLAAMTVHGLWNGMSSLTTNNNHWNSLYFFFWIPFVAIMTFTLITVRRGYKKDKEKILNEAVQSQYIKDSQSQKILDRKTRKALYRSAEYPNDIVQWENALLQADYWLKQSDTTNAKKAIKMKKKQSNELMKLSQVIQSV